MLAQALLTGQRWLCFPRKEQLYEHRPPEVAKPARGGSKKGPPDGSFVPVGPNLAAKAARKPILGSSWALLGRSWGVLGRSWGRLTDRRVLNPTRGKIPPGQVSIFSSNLAPQKGAKTTPRRPKIDEKIVLKNDRVLQWS